MAYLAPGPRLFQKVPKEVFYKLLAFSLTYLTYLAYHIAKRPIAVVENSIKFLDCSDTLNETSINSTDPECEWSWVNEMNGVSKVILTKKLFKWLCVHRSFNQL